MMRSSQTIEKKNEPSPSDINSRYNDFLKFIEDHPQYEATLRPFCNHIEKILNAWTNAGVTEKRLVRAFTCVEQVLENPNLKTILALYEQSVKHEKACQTKIKVGAGEVTGGSLFSAGVYGGLSALSLFSPPVVITVAATTAAASAIAGAATAFDSTNKSGNFSKILKDIVKTKIDELLENKDYKTYAAALIGQEKLNAKYRGSSKNCIEILTNCIEQLHKLNGSNLYDICIKLISAHLNLNGKHPDSLKKLENIIHFFGKKMLEQDNYKEFAIIKINLILNFANCREKNIERDKILVTLSNNILHLENANNNPEKIRGLIETTITDLKKESKSRNKFGLETSKSAIELKELILDNLSVCRFSNRP